MSQLNVAIFINSFNLGGAEKLMYDVSEALSRKTNIFLVAMKSAQTDFEKNVYNQLREKGINVDTIDKQVGKGKVKAIIDIIRFVRKNRINVIHTNGQSPDFFARIAKLFCPGVKIVVTIHSTGGYRRRTEENLQKITNYYTAVSEQAKEYAHKSLGIKKEVFVIPNGVVHERYISEKERNGKKILSVGRVMRQKGYVDVADGMCSYLRCNPEAEWIIVGDKVQSPEYYDEVLSHIADDVKDRVHFTGAVTNPEEYYKNADCFILPSEFEGFGIAFIEAMVAGLPVIARNVGVIPEIVGMGGGVVGLGVDNISECIEKAFAMDSSVLDKNRQLCIDTYSMESIAQRYLDIYNKPE